MKTGRHSLSTVTAMAIAAMLVLSIAIIYASIAWYAGRSTEAMLEGLPREAGQAYRDLTAGLMPSMDGLKMLLTLLPSIEERLDFQLFLSIALFGLLATLICSFIGYGLARRIARPLEQLATAAESLRGGDFAVSPGNYAGGTREVARLGKTIDALASDLERMENRLRFNSMAIAHELRTPLTILQGNLQGMIDGVFPVHPKGLNDLLVQVEGLGRLVEDLRTLSLAAGQRLVEGKVASDLGQETGTVLDAMGSILGAAGMRVETEFRPAPAMIDRQRVRQALIALIDNARQYAASGGVLRCETDVNHAGEAYVRFMDRGPGLPEHMRNISFDIFWRAEPSRSRATGGTGLGLSVVEAIAKAHNGRLEATARDGGGSVFTIVLAPTPEAEAKRAGAD